ncbi:MAG: aminotransferase class V-fold PLP-dependent enzyme [Thermoplasmatales archaeon]
MASAFSRYYIREIRKRFPRIDRDFAGNRRIFVDNGAGSLVLREAAEAEMKARLDFSANTSAIYPESKGNEEIIENGRKAISDLLDAPSYKLIFQGESASELFFRISYSLRSQFNDGSNVVSTYAEHFANVAPYLEMKKNGVLSDLRLAKISREDGSIDMNDLGSLVNSKTRVIAITAESNLLGNKTNLEDVSKIAKENDSILIVDGVHYVPQAYSSVGKYPCDFFVFSSYKVFGPRGSFMYVSKNALSKMKPYFVDREATENTGSYLEPGTRDQSIFAAMSSVVDYLSSLSLDIRKFRVGKPPKNRRIGVRKGMRRVEIYQQELNRAVLEGIDDAEGLNNIRNVKLYGSREPGENRGSTFSFNFTNINDRLAEDLYWKRFRITVVGGSHWNLTHDFLSVPSMLRATFLHYNTKEEVKEFLLATKWIASRS